MCNTMRLMYCKPQPMHGPVPCHGIASGYSEVAHHAAKNHGCGSQCWSVHRYAVIAVTGQPHTDSARSCYIQTLDSITASLKRIDHTGITSAEQCSRSSLPKKNCGLRLQVQLVMISGVCTNAHADNISDRYSRSKSNLLPGTDPQRLN